MCLCVGVPSLFEKAWDIFLSCLLPLKLYHGPWENTSVVLASTYHLSVHLISSLFASIVA